MLFDISEHACVLAGEHEERPSTKAHLWAQGMARGRTQEHSSGTQVGKWTEGTAQPSTRVSSERLRQDEGAAVSARGIKDPGAAPDCAWERSAGSDLAGRG